MLPTNFSNTDIQNINKAPPKSLEKFHNVAQKPKKEKKDGLISPVHELLPRKLLSKDSKKDIRMYCE